jgi:hypothetical protein
VNSLLYKQHSKRRNYGERRKNPELNCFWSSGATNLQRL